MLLLPCSGSPLWLSEAYRPSLTTSSSVEVRTPLSLVGMNVSISVQPVGATNVAIGPMLEKTVLGTELIEVHGLLPESRYRIVLAGALPTAPLFVETVAVGTLMFVSLLALRVNSICVYCVCSHCEVSAA